MIYDFSNIKSQNDRLEDEIQTLKIQYQKTKMTKEQLENLKSKMEETDMENSKKRAKKGIVKFTAAAAVIAGFIALPNTSATVAHAMGQMPVIGQLAEAVTFRDYSYESEKNNADIKTPEINVSDDLTDDAKTEENLKQSAEKINAEIQDITDKLVKEFKTNLENEEGVQDIMVDSEILTTAKDYFTLKLNCYQSAGSGYEWNYYYTINLKNGNRMQLQDLFKEGANYVTPISENIKKQMREQMKADENVIYNLDSDIEEWNFESITEETSFYLNEQDQAVICFNEGEVAPMYMGTVEFVIPSEVLKDIRK